MIQESFKSLFDHRYSIFDHRYPFISHFYLLFDHHYSLFEHRYSSFDHLVYPYDPSHAFAAVHSSYPLIYLYNVYMLQDI